MKKQLLLILAILPIVVVCQMNVLIDSVESDSGQKQAHLKIVPHNKDNSKLQIFQNTGTDVRPTNTLKISDNAIVDCETMKAEGLKDLPIKYDVDCDENTVLFYINNDKTKGVKVHIANNKFVKGDPKPRTDEDEVFKFIPVPIIKYYSGSAEYITNRRNRKLIIDLNPNYLEREDNGLYQIKDSLWKSGDNNRKVVYKKKRKAVYYNNSFSVWLRNYNIINTEEISVNINGKNYSYTKDINDLLALVNERNKGDGNSENIVPTKLDSEDSVRIEIDPVYSYLNRIYSAFGNYKYLNIDDYKRIIRFQNELTTELSKLKSISDASLILSDSILSWAPEHICLTPISKLIPDNDELEVSISYKKGEETISEKVGEYKVIGGHVPAISGAVFLTGLYSELVYTDSVAVDSSHNELRALTRYNSQSTVGFGVKLETAFRTGSIFRPTIHVGFFIPFEQNITPYLALGGGFSITSKKVVYSISGGLAGGFVNRLNPDYDGKDLSGYSNYVEKLTIKEPKLSWQIALGVSFNIE